MLRPGRTERSEPDPSLVVEEPAFAIQPDEMRAYKELRVLIDRQFLNCNPFWSPENVHSDIIPSPEGVNMYLRSRLFPILSRIKPTESHPPCHNEQQAQSMLEENRISEPFWRFRAKLTHRESKQKYRSESRLLSLLFAAVYDVNTRKCSLLHGIPPLRVLKQDKNGKQRRVSNFTEVRTFLREKMMRSISIHANATRTMFELGPEHILLLPVITVSIARTFLPFYYSLNNETDMNSRACGVEAVSLCLDSVCGFITKWERRSYTSDLELSCSLQANRSHRLYKATEGLLASMIKVLPPSKPTIDVFKKSVVYNHGIVANNMCKPGKHKSCAVCDLSNHSENIYEVLPANKQIDACRQYVEAVSRCIALQPPALRNLNSAVGVEENRVTIWKSILSTVSVHRLQSLSREAITDPGSMPNHASTEEFVEAVRWDVARMWIALDTSTEDVLSYITDMKVEGKTAVLQAVTDIVIGTTLTTRALFEETESIKKVLESLHLRKRHEDSSKGLEWNEHVEEQYGNRNQSRIQSCENDLSRSPKKRRLLDRDIRQTPSTARAPAGPARGEPTISLPLKKTRKIWDS